MVKLQTLDATFDHRLFAKCREVRLVNVRFGLLQNMEVNDVFIYFLQFIL